MENNSTLNESRIASVVKTIRFEFWLWTIALALLSGMSFYFASSIPKLDGTTTISVQSMLMLLLLIGFPSVFIWFKNKMIALKSVEDFKTRMHRYEAYSRIRQFVFFLFGLSILTVQLLTIFKGAPMMLLIIVVLGFFIVPSRTRLMMEANLISDQEAIGSEEEEL